MQKIVAYYRVSTQRQGRSGLGLEAQRHAVQQHASSVGGKVVAEYTEIESGRCNERQQLANAIGHARLAKATLVVAKLDRLSRNVSFLSQLLDSKVDFVACDNPHANKLTIHILAAMAEHEAVAIADRTRNALRMARRRGVQLGSARPNHWRGREHLRAAGLRKAQKASANARRQAASEADAFLVPSMRERHESGDSLQSIANWLNSNGHTTRSGKPWQHVAVMRVLQRATK